MDAQSPQIGIRPIYVPDADLSEWHDRRGVYVVTTVMLPRDVDAEQAVAQLGQLVTAARYFHARIADEIRGGRRADVK